MGSLSVVNNISLKFRFTQNLKTWPYLEVGLAEVMNDDEFILARLSCDLLEQRSQRYPLSLFCFSVFFFNETTSKALSLLDEHSTTELVPQASMSL